MNKTPISFLQELMMARGQALPKYTDVESDRVGYNFKCIVNCEDNVEGVGYGNSKKGAKHSSAQDALKKMGSNLDVAPSENENPTKGPDNDVAGSFVSLNGNYIGTLNEMAAQMCRTNPTFEGTMAGIGLFKVTCRFLGIVTTGTGSSKKIAKQMSAKNMLMEIKTKGPDFIFVDSISVPSEEEKIGQALKDVTTLKDKIKNLIVNSESDEKSPSEITNTVLKSLKEQLGDSKIKVFLNQNSTHYIMFKLEESPITLMGVGVTEKEAIENLLQTVSHMNKSFSAANL